MAVVRLSDHHREHNGEPPMRREVANAAARPLPPPAAACPEVAIAVDGRPGRAFAEVRLGPARPQKGCAQVPFITVRGLQLAYEEYGAGPPVLLIPPAATPAGVWAMHQIPAIVAAGYRVIAADSRGTPPSSVPIAPFRLADLTDDAACLITELGLAPCLIVGASLGAMAGQELALSRPDLVRAAALLGTRCRTDFIRGRFARAYADQVRRGEPPSDLDAVMLVMQMFSSATLADDRRAADWLALFQVFSARGVGSAMQYEATLIPDRTEALHQVQRPCLVVGFSEDAVTPPALGREVASAIPGCRYVELEGCGHFGFLERPEPVNAALIDFFAAVH
jgi:pimeloyl-ACP methyl ester carboxylesterase